MKKITFVILLTLLLAGVSLAGGFELYEFGARVSTLGGAAVARAWDASTIFYNPSGLAFVEGTNFYGGMTFIIAKNVYTGANPLFTGEEHESKDAFHTPIGIYFSHQFNEKLFAGISVTNLFGLGLQWEEDWPGRGIAHNTDLKSFYISPVVAYKLSDSFSIGGGLDIVMSTITLERAVFLFGSEGSPGTEVGNSRIEGNTGPTIGFTASANFRGEKLGLGFLYRHKIKNVLDDGEIKFDLIDSPIRSFAEGLLVDQAVKSELTYPNFFAVGVYYKFTGSMGIEVDYLWHNWSVFDELPLEFEDPLLNQTINQDYENSHQIRVGLHYDLSEKLQLRTGYIWDQTPQPIHSVSPLLPDNDRNDYTIGLGYTHNNMQFDAGYMFVDFGERSTVENGVGQNEFGFDGTYATNAHLFFFSYGINF